MELRELLDFIESEHERLRNKYQNLDKQKEILARCVKLSEEVGELSNEVLSLNSFQRYVKLEKHGPEKVEEEIADVIITTLLLAKSMGVNVEKSLQERIENVKAREY